MNNTKKINVKNRMYYFFVDIINIKILYPNKIKTDGKSYKNILMCHNGYVKVKEFSYAAINSVNPLFSIINKINKPNEESNGNKYLTLVLIDESNKTLNKYEELWNQIRDLIGSLANNSDNYDENYVTIKFNSDHNLPLNWKKTLELYNMIAILRSVFQNLLQYCP